MRSSVRSKTTPQSTTLRHRRLIRLLARRNPILEYSSVLISREGRMMESQIVIPARLTEREREREKEGDRWRVSNTNKKAWSSSFACTFNVVALRVAFVPIEWEKRERKGGEKGGLAVAREEKTNDSKGQSGTGMEHSLGCCSLWSCNEMGGFLGCSLLRPWYRPIGGCCYLRLVTSLHPSVCSWNLGGFR